MITTVTTTTVTTLAAGASLAILIVIALLAILMSKELLGDKSEGARRFSKSLNVAVVPLALVFCVTVAMKLLELI